MGALYCFLAALLFGGVLAELCEVNGCNCTNTAGSWRTINCTFDASQKITLSPGSIPEDTLEISIVGGEEITVEAQSFHVLRGFGLLRIDGARNLLLRRHAFDNLNSTSLDFQILNCNSLVLEGNAFKNMQTPIRAEIFHCHHVSIQNSVFSRLQEATFKDIYNLELGEGAFTFENQGGIGRHGPVTNLSFHTVTIPKIPRATFTSVLAEINIQDSEIVDILPEAFKAGQINSILLNGSKIHRVHSGALSDQTLIYSFLIQKCTVRELDNQAIMAAITNLTVKFSLITEIHNAAITSVTAHVIVADNKIKRLASHAFIFYDWNSVRIDNNIISKVGSNFLDVHYHPGVQDFSFYGNEIWEIDDGALVAVPELKYRVNHFTFDNNSFRQTCYCDIADWLSRLLNNTFSHYVFTSSFCKVDSNLSHCFAIEEGLINMRNFTELVCGPGTVIKCEPYKGETKFIDATNSAPFDEDEQHSNFVLGVTLVSLLVIAIVATIVILLIKTGMWLKQKGYCASMDHNGVSREDEGVMVPDEEGEKYETPEELTHELLQQLREQLENPETHNEAREMIERLYEQFVVVVDDAYTNNNRQEEEAHLYEELGNMQSGRASDGIASYLKMMEEKLNIPLIDQDEYKPPLVTEYSEPTDAAVHLYSELKNKIEEDGEKKGSVKSHSSNGSRMAFRPLPEKPKDEAGPSTKY